MLALRALGRRALVLRRPALGCDPLDARSVGRTGVGPAPYTSRAVMVQGLAPSATGVTFLIPGLDRSPSLRPQYGAGRADPLSDIGDRPTRSLPVIETVSFR